MKRRPDWMRSSALRGLERQAQISRAGATANCSELETRIANAVRFYKAHPPAHHVRATIAYWNIGRAVKELVRWEYAARLQPVPPRYRG